jgi:hypothetical protein
MPLPPPGGGGQPGWGGPPGLQPGGGPLGGGGAGAGGFCAETVSGNPRSKSVVIEYIKRLQPFNFLYTLNILR